MSIKTLKLFNTLSRQTEDFKSISPDQVKIYCCGPTVYNYQHIGNFKTFIVENLLIKTLELAGYKTNFVMNITDVGHLVSDADVGEDKMLLAAKKENKKSHEIADYYTEHFFKDWDNLNLKRPDTTCKATDHITDMIDLIKRIEAAGYAYVSGGNVYFDVDKFKSYGDLAKLNLKDLQAGARVDVDLNKKGAHDFVLWFTKSKFEGQELVWDSPWGVGYPGWHIECSAMAMKYLGEQFDIHCGGIDHIPVHHSNEIAQSEAATGKKWVNFWVHSEFILLNSEKMSKSKGGFIVLDDLIELGFPPLAFKFLCLSTHYRKQLNFSEKALENAKTNLNKLLTEVVTLKSKVTASDKFSEQGKSLQAAFETSIFNDLNTPQAIAVIWKTLGNNDLPDAEKLGLLYYFDLALGLDLKNYQIEVLDIPSAVSDLAEQRKLARENKDWAASDRIRDQIADLGFKVVDSGGEQKIEKL